jgi:hypothetical protein
VAATLPNPVLEDAQPRQQTALSAVFRRLANEIPMPSPVPEAEPEFEGFAEPVSEPSQDEILIPEIEEFAPIVAEASAEPAGIELAERAVEQVETRFIEAEDEPLAEEPPHSASPAPELPLAEAPVPEPLPSPPAEEPPHSASPVPELPPAETPVLEPLPSPPAPRLPGSLATRLGLRPEEVPSAMPHAAAPAPAPQQQAPQPPPEPTQRPSAPGPSPAMNRGGPSMPRNRRLHRRVRLPAEMEIDGVPCTMIDVSIGGFAATGVPAFEANSIVPVTIRLTIDGIEVGTQLNARIIYVTQGRSSGRFIELTPAQAAFLRYIVTWRGESIGAVGTTTLLDAISGGLERDLSPGSADRFGSAPRSRWWAGMIGRKVKPPR